MPTGGSTKIIQKYSKKFMRNILRRTQKTLVKIYGIMVGESSWFEYGATDLGTDLSQSSEKYTEEGATFMPETKA